MHLFFVYMEKSLLHTPDSLYIVRGGLLSVDIIAMRVDRAATEIRRYST